MIHPISANTVTEAWLRAFTVLEADEDHCAYNVILDIDNPVVLTPTDKSIVKLVDALLVSHDKHPIATVAGTIFPASLYKQHGPKGVLEIYPTKVYPRLQKSWGTYAGRMLLTRLDHQGREFSPLKVIIEKLRRQTSHTGPKRAVYEVSLVDLCTDIHLYDPGRDAKLVMNQPCLAHLSFKLRKNRELMLTAFYRNHYYIERALGNLIGLSQLLYFVAHESGLAPGSLVCHSTFARIDLDGGWTSREVAALIREARQAYGMDLQGRDKLKEG